jgi:hypothetical protein
MQTWNNYSLHITHSTLLFVVCLRTLPLIVVKSVNLSVILLTSSFLLPRWDYSHPLLVLRILFYVIFSKNSFFLWRLSFARLSPCFRFSKLQSYWLLLCSWKRVQRYIKYLKVPSVFRINFQKNPSFSTYFTKSRSIKEYTLFII